jgi:2-methylcitrate dehydratase PrpD
MSDHEHRAAEFASTLTLSACPASVVDEAALLTADTLGAIIGGAPLEPVSTLARTIAENHSGSAVIHGTDLTATPSQAAFVDGVGGSVLELNAGHKYAAGHPVVQIFPAIFTEAVGRDSDGERFLTAFIASYEICTRAARASRPLKDEYLPHGVWGTVGATAGIGRLRGFDTETMLRAMQVGASFAQHTRFEATGEGATGVRNGAVGMSNLAAIVAADLAESGFGGLDGGVTRHLGMTTGETFRSEVLDDRLGEHWEIERGYYKCHASGRLVHPALDAVAAIQQEHEIDPGAVERVIVETYRKAAIWDGTDRPRNRLQAKSSIPFGVASRLVHGSSGRDAFETTAISDEVMDLASRVEVVVDDELDRRVPRARSARVTLETTAGTTLVEEVEHAKGGEERPYSVDRLREKFRQLTVPVLGENRADRLWSGATSLPEVEPSRLSELARPEGSR